MISVVIPYQNDNSLLKTIESIKDDVKIIPVFYGNKTNIDWGKNLRANNFNNAVNIGVQESNDIVVLLGEGAVVSETWSKCLKPNTAGPVYIKSNFSDYEYRYLLGGCEYNYEREELSQLEKFSIKNVCFLKEDFLKLGGLNAVIDTQYFFIRDMINIGVLYDSRMSVTIEIPYSITDRTVYNLAYKNGWIDYDIDRIEKPKKLNPPKKELHGYHYQGYYDNLYGSGYKEPFPSIREHSSINYFIRTEENLIYLEKPKIRIAGSGDKCLCMIAPDEYSKRELDITIGPAKAYAKKYKYEFLLIEDTTTEHKCSHKFILSDVAQNYNQVLYIDCDVLIKDAPDILETENDFALMPETEHLPKSTKDGQIMEMKRLCAYANFRFKRSEWYNAGVMLFDKSISRVYTPPKFQVPDYWCVEQHWLNIMINQLSKPVRHLDVKFNTGWYWKKFLSLCKDAYFIHLNGCPQPLRLDFLKYFIHHNQVSTELFKKSMELSCPPKWE